MVALRAFRTPASSDHDAPPSADRDWLSMEQAACELDVSVSTVRRWMRAGKLRNRVEPRRGGIRYLVYVPNSRHGRLLDDACAQPVSITERIAERDARRIASDASARDEVIRRLEQQVEHLSHALSRTLRTRQKALPAGIGQADVNATDPYARYRWLARRKRWWPF
jgi:hypothetical protein